MSIPLTKKIIEEHILIVDTNVLHGEGKEFPINSAFDKFWQEHSAEFNLTLKVPEVVIGELLFQQTTSALKTLERANDSIDRIAEITSKKYSHQITENRVKREIDERINSWLNSKKGSIIHTPYKEIDWAKVVTDSVWRIPPFSYDPKKEDLEKGFRDYIILETACIDSLENPEKQYIFVTGDKLLKKSAEERMAETQTFKAMLSMDEVASHFKLLRQNFTEDFVKSIVKKASLKFLKDNDNNCVVRKFSLNKELRTLAKDVIEDPSSRNANNDNEFFSDETWTPISKGTFLKYGDSQFIEIESARTFLWKEDVRFERKYNVEDWEGPHEAELVLYFEVKWQANVSENGRFTKVKYLSSELVDTKIKWNSTSSDA